MTCKKTILLYWKQCDWKIGSICLSRSKAVNNYFLFRLHRLKVKNMKEAFCTIFFDRIFNGFFNSFVVNGAVTIFYMKSKCLFHTAQLFRYFRFNKKAIHSNQFLLQINLLRMDSAKLTSQERMNAGSVRVSNDHMWTVNITIAFTCC